MAGNARFHNKWHRRGHHSSPSVGYPDSATDPIASREEPFVGDFYLAGSLSASGNATIMGSLCVLGDLSYIDTIVSVTSALSVVNMGTGPAFTVVQYGAQPIARFIDGDAVGGARAALFIENNGQIIINGTNPSLTRTVSLYGTLSGSGNCEFQSGSAADGQQSAAFNQSLAQGYQSFAAGSSIVRGRYGFGTGINTTATGSAASVFGQNTTASNDASHAEGIKTTASGRGAHAEGILTEARERGAHAEGISTIAQGEVSHAEGIFSKALSAYSHAEGYQTVASGLQSHSEGSGTASYGDSSHAEGNLTEAYGINSHAEGTSTDAEGAASHAEGAFSIAKGAAAHSEGYLSLAEGNYSHAEGKSTTASGESSHAEGNVTSAIGNYSHAQGSLTVASGIGSFASGYLTSASGDFSFAQGNNTIVSGLYATGLGTNNRASKNASVAIGNNANAERNSAVVISSNTNKYNSSAFSDHTFNVFASGGNFLFDSTTVGDPASGVAFIVLSSGLVGINTPLPNERLTINGNVSCFGYLSATSINYHPYINNGGLSAIAIDPGFNLIQGRVGINTAPLSTFALHIRGGNVRVDGVDYSKTPNVSAFDTDGQSLFDLRSGARDLNYSLSIAESGLRHFIKFFGGRQNDANPFVAVNQGDSLRFARVGGFYFAGGFTEMGRFDLSGNFGIGSFNGLNGAENNNLTLPARLTVAGSVSSSGPLSATGSTNYFANNVGIGTSWPSERLTVFGSISTNRTVLANALSTRSIDLIHEPANDGTNPLLRIGEVSDTTNLKGFSGALIDYDENNNLFRIRSAFGPTPNDAISIDRSGDVTVANNLIVNGNSTLGNDASDTVTVNAGPISLVNATAAGDALEFGSGANLANLYRSANDTLKTDDNFEIGINGGKTTLNLSSNNNNVGLSIGDTNLYREGSNALKTDDALTVDLNFSVNGNTILGSDSNDEVTINAGPVKLINATAAGDALEFGSGANLANLYRSANDTLKTDDNFVVGTLATGTTDSIIIHNANVLQTRTVNSRVWDTGATFLSGQNLSENYIPKALKDNNTLVNSSIHNSASLVSTTVPLSTTKIIALASDIGVTVDTKILDYIFTDADNNKIIHFNTSAQTLSAIFPSNLRTDFNCAIMNTGTNKLMLSTYAPLKAVSNIVSVQYGSAFVYKDSGNDIYAVGRL